MLDKLKRAGFNWLALGIEAADERVLTDVDKRYRVDRGLRHGRESQGRRHQHHRQLHLRPARRHARTRCSRRSTWRSISTASSRTSTPRWPIPGSPLYRAGDRAAAGGCRTRWSGYSQHAVDTLPLPTRHLSAGDVLRFRDDAFHRYFESDDTWIWSGRLSANQRSRTSRR